MENPMWKNERSPGYPPHPGYPPQQQGYHEQPKSAYPAQPTSPTFPQQGYPSQGYIQQQPVSTQNTTVVMIQQPSVVAVQVPYINDYLGLSIFSCLCCCWVIGIFAIIKSCQARNLNAYGDYNSAMVAAKSARNLSIASIVCAIGISIIIIIIYESVK